MNLDLKTGAPSVKVERASLLRYEKAISVTSAILISKVQLCPTSSGVHVHVIESQCCHQGREEGKEGGRGRKKGGEEGGREGREGKRGEERERGGDVLNYKFTVIEPQCCNQGNSFFPFVHSQEIMLVSLSSLRRAGCGLGGDYHSVARQRALCVPLSYHPQRPTVCRVDLPPTQAGVCVHSVCMCVKELGRWGGGWRGRGGGGGGGRVKRVWKSVGIIKGIHDIFF